MVKRITTLFFAALFCGFFSISIVSAENNDTSHDGDTDEVSEPTTGGDNQENNDSGTGGTGGETENTSATEDNGTSHDGDKGDGNDGGSNGGGTTASAQSTTSSANREDSCRQALPSNFDRSRRTKACNGPFFRN